jgi:protein TonB
MIKSIKVLLIVIGLFITLIGCAQGQKQAMKPAIPYYQATKIPMFTGGYTALHAFVAKNLKWPSSADVQGSVLLSFDVQSDGKVSSIHVEKSLAIDFDNEAKRVIFIMPKWIPGELNHQKVSVKMYLPINFIMR